MHISHANLVKERGSAPHDGSDLCARITQLELKDNASSIAAAESAAAVRERNRYQVLSQSAATQVQGLHEGYAGIVSCTKCGLSFLRDGPEPFLNEVKSASSPE